jgi:nucleotide-binding universal stress UspA family protein
LELSFLIARTTKAAINIINVVSYQPVYIPVQHTDFPASNYLLPPDIFSNYSSEINIQLKNIRESKSARGQKIITEVVQGANIFDAIIEYSEKKHADMIIMGTKGNTDLKDIMIGSNAERVIRYSKLPVMVVSAKTANKNIKKLLFASDFTEEAYNIFPSVRKFSDKLKTEINLVKINTREYFRSSAVNYDLIKKFMKKFKLNLNYFVYDDYIKEDGIVRYAHEIKADIIVLGTHGKKGLNRFFSENVSGDLVNTSPLPVLTFNFKSRQ